MTYPMKRINQYSDNYAPLIDDIEYTGEGAEIFDWPDFGVIVFDNDIEQRPDNDTE